MEIFADICVFSKSSRFPSSEIGTGELSGINYIPRHEDGCGSGLIVPGIVWYNRVVSFRPRPLNPPRKIPIEQVAGSAAEPIWTLCNRKKLFLCRQSNFDCLVAQSMC